MVLLLCVAIVILICFLIGGISRAGTARSGADSTRLPLTVMSLMMLMSLLGMAWAARMPHQPPQPTQVMMETSEIFASPTSSHFQLLTAEPQPTGMRVEIAPDSVNVQLTDGPADPAPPAQEETPSQAEKQESAPTEGPCGCG